MHYTGTIVGTTWSGGKASLEVGPYLAESDTSAIDKLYTAKAGDYQRVLDVECVRHERIVLETASDDRVIVVSDMHTLVKRFTDERARY